VSRFELVFFQASGIFPRRGFRVIIVLIGMIYLIYKDGEILVETDNADFVKDYIKTDPECSVRDLRTGKKIALE
jgi:hypothetical protein